jgi:hypothetical protein
VIERVKWRKREIEKNTQFMIVGVKWRNREMEKKYTVYDRRCEMEKQRDGEKIHRL